MINLPQDPRAQTYTDSGVWGRVTLDALFRRNIARAPDRLALVDGADRATWTDGMPRSLTYRQADQMVSAVAARLTELGLRPGSVVGIQLPNIVEAPITILACLRAGLIPCVLPLLWRTREIVSALETMLPKALISVTRAGDETPADTVRYAAAELFTVRFVLAYGQNPPDGVIGIEAAPEREPRPAPAAVPPGSDVAMVTFRTTGVGHAAVPRSHNHWVASGLASVLEAGMEPGEVIATSIMPTSFAGLASTLLPWLLTGGTLVLHQPFTPDALVRLLTEEKATRCVVPGPLLGEIAPFLAEVPSLQSITALFPDARGANRRERLAIGPAIVDVAAFDEWGLVATRRDDGAPRPLPHGEVHQPVGGNGPVLIETRALPSGRLAIRGPMVPFDPQGEDGYRPTDIAVRGEGDGMTVTGRLDGVAYVGGLAVGANELETALARAEEVDAVRVNAVTDPLFGERIEAYVAPRAATGLSDESIVERLHGRLDRLGFAPFKVPSRIVIDNMVRADASARRAGV
jgi:mycobactin salicyl-AMP ligase